MINQKEAKEATQQDCNDLVELMTSVSPLVVLDWYDMFFDSVVEILLHHREYDPAFAEELDEVNPEWNKTINTHGVYHNDT